MNEVDSMSLYFNIHHTPPIDTDPGIFESFFHDKRFTSWSKADRSWQLHLYGGPGCGKTTLAYLIANYLQDNTVFPVVTVFIQGASRGRAPQRIEDLVAAIYHELILDRPLPGVSESERMCRDGSPSSVPFDELQNALRARLSCLQTVFFIMDGFDELSNDMQESVKDRLSQLDAGTLKVLLTRRVPLFRPPPSISYSCDECDESNLRLFWECQRCVASYAPGRSVWILCYSCKARDGRCPEPSHGDSLVEPYSHVNIPIPISAEGLRRFVKRDLESEFVQSILDKSRANLTIVRLRLDQARELESVQEMSNLSDRLPRGVVALYDMALDRVSALAGNEREAVLIALVAVAEKPSIPLDDLETLLRGITRRQKLDYPNTENVLRKAYGLLSMDIENPLSMFRGRISCYHPDLGSYVRENYNREIMSVSDRLERAKTTKAGPTMTWSSTGSDFSALELSSPGDAKPLSPDVEANLMSPFSLAASKQDTTDSGYFSSVSSHERLPRVSTMPLTSFGSESALVHSPDKDPGKETAYENVSILRSICAFCRENIVRANTLEGYHHRSLEDLAASEEAGCPFCSSIYQNVRTAFDNEQKQIEDLEWTRNVWTLRTTSKTTNTKPILAVTFRPLISRPNRLIARFYIISEDDLGRLPDARQLGNSTQPSQTGSQIRDWIQKCDRTHQYCELKSTESWLPTRLVDIDTEDRSMIRVVNTKKNAIQGPYVTLSHCWGKSPIFTLLRSNEGTLTAGVSIEKLTKNFQEAIEIARLINVKYIWIDSLCIVQGPGGDFEVEGQYMHKVYRLSYCNIVAADSTDSSGGLFRPRKPNEIIPASYTIDGESILERGTWKILDEQYWSKQLLGSPVYSRGWVFQERMLSPRILHFTKSQIFWDCSTLSACEVLPDGLPFSLDGYASTDRHWRGRLLETPEGQQSASIQGPNDDSLEKFWKNALLTYTSCDLTHQTDKTIAVWSVAKLVRDSLQVSDEYGCGLWANALHEQLAWRVQNCVKDARMEVLQFCNPSWSWASVSGPVIAQERIVSHRHYVVQSHAEEKISFSLKDQKGDRDQETKLVEPASIDLDGYLGNATLIADPHNGTWTFALPASEVPPTKRNNGNAGDFQVYLDEPPEEDRFPLRECFFVILAASGPQTSHMTQPLQQPNHKSAQDVNYSGIGLILTSHEEYRDRQRCILKTLLVQLLNHKLWEPDTADKKRSALVERIANLMKWRKKLAERENLHNPGPYFRRIGALQFRDVCVETWKRIEDLGRTKFWLD